MKVAVASGKGGTGKTTLAVNLARFMAEREPVVLVDLDVEEPNAGLFLHGAAGAGETLVDEIRNKAVPVWDGDACGHCGRCADVCNFNAILDLGAEIMIFPELCHSCHACSELCPESALPMTPRPVGTLRHIRLGRLDAVESTLHVGEEQATPLIRQTLDATGPRAPEGAPWIMDAPPGTACPMVEAVRDADLVLLVTEPTPFGLHDLELAVETVRALGRPFAVVINRDGIGDDGVDAYCAAEGIEILARIPHDRAVAELYAAGEMAYPRAPALRDAVATVAARVRELAGEAAR